jgi:hypothetical protein
MLEVKVVVDQRLRVHAKRVETLDVSAHLRLLNHDFGVKSTQQAVEYNYCSWIT